MKLTARDRRALLLLGVGFIGLLIWRYAVSGGETASVVSAETSIPDAERRLLRLRSIAASVPLRQQNLDAARKELASRERGLIQAETAAQAQAQLVQIVRRVARAQSPPVEIRNVEISAPRALSADYGEVVVGVTFDCRVEQFVNFLVSLTEQPELISTYDLRVGNANPKDKGMPVRLIVAGVVRRTLIPDQKQGSGL